MTQQRLTSGQSPSDFPSDYWEHIATYLEEGLAIIDNRHTLVFFNAAAESLTGVAQTQVRGISYTQVFDENPWIVALIRRAQEPGYSRTAGEGELRDRFRRVVPVRVTCSPIFDQNDCPLGFVLVLHDLSHQKELEEEQQRDDRLTSLGVVAAGLAHEIKNPLAGIRGAAQLLQSRLKADPSAVKYTTIMVNEIDRLSALLEQLLELSACPHFDPRPVNIHKTITDVLLLEQATASKGTTVQTHFDPSLPLVLGDEARLSQVFRNLIKNSLQALRGQRGGVLSIATKMATDFHLVRLPLDRAAPLQPGSSAPPPQTPPPDAPEKQPLSDKHTGGRFLSIIFADNGPGITPDHLPHLFTPFFTTKSQGTGLGLPVSQQIIAQHGGTIRVESSPGQGAGFHVYLPVPPG